MQSFPVTFSFYYDATDAAKILKQNYFSGGLFLAVLIGINVDYLLFALVNVKEVQALLLLHLLTWTLLKEEKVLRSFLRMAPFHF